MPMIQNFTPEDLIRFIYRETTPQEDLSIRKWLMDDVEAFETFQNLSDTVSSLHVKNMEPSETSVSILLEFSKLSAHEASHA